MNSWLLLASDVRDDEKLRLRPATPEMRGPSKGLIAGKGWNCSPPERRRGRQREGETERERERVRESRAA